MCLQGFSSLLQNGGSGLCSGETPGRALGEEQSRGRAGEAPFEISSSSTC